ncbi:8-amino-7-oxononanoate synthase [Thiovibrio frasassiensis]|uniref:8-amino-7-ketopelargonate synthase n=1 Tax=Thiovibrio frasassiensis TaxID=2984131 RepID=A0A9X4MF95_9BACT|nr:8-amino-7-oxononanoate synthase [Thiovibrio frasassiensis]MDG4475572.1 8-amino-7-oxononanoate synthase [Thiovibrio frasassiensis]
MVDLKTWLSQQQEKGGLRSLRPVSSRAKGRLTLAGDGNRELIDFSSNDYLALAEHPALIAAAQQALLRFGTGSGASRLMSGDLAVHHELEEAMATLKGKEAALTFGSGYMANTGIIPALMNRHDCVFSDRLNHASIHDGCRLSGARVIRFRHNDLNHLEELLMEKRGTGTALIVVESIYSMDGDRCPLRELVAIKERFGCLLMVDEAHATGVFGAKGGGIIEEDGVSSGVDLAMGTFGKALGSYGAYVAGNREMIDYLLNRARSFVFSTALPPAVAAASLAAVQLIQQEPELRHDLQAKMAYFKGMLRAGGYLADLGPSQIIPIQVGESKAALAKAELLRKERIFATAVRPPTVPEGTARLRFSITRHHSTADLAQAAKALLEVMEL